MMLSRVISDASPKQAKDDQVAMLRMNARPSQFDHLRAKWLEDIEFELLRAVVTTMRRRIEPGLQSVCADDIGGRQVLNDEMIANSIEAVFVQPGRVGFFKSFAEFEIEDLKSQGLRGADFIQVTGKPRAVAGR